MQKVLIIPGLGADKSAFEKVVFPENWEITFLDWLEPLKNETIELYCIRIYQKYNIEFDILIGLSFGSIILQEILKLMKITPIIILISGIISVQQIKYYNLMKYVIDYIPAKIFTIPNPVIRYLFSIKNADSKFILNSIIKNTNPKIAKWSLQQLLIWNGHNPNNIYNMIHGDSDKLVSAINKNNCKIIKGAGHFLVYDNHRELSLWLQEINNN